MTGAGAAPVPVEWRGGMPMLDDAEVEALAQAALATGSLQVHHRLRLILAPDVLIVQAAANGGDVDGAWRLLRSDGRVVYIYSDPRPAPGAREAG